MVLKYFYFQARQRLGDCGRHKVVVMMFVMVMVVVVMFVMVVMVMIVVILMVAEVG